MSKDASATPLMTQYREIKARHPNAILFFRMGDFYEMFYEDAEVAARALDLTLTSRNNGGSAGGSRLAPGDDAAQRGRLISFLSTVR